MHHIPHSTYYRDRASEYELCNDFPGDEILIDGLHAMQMHFLNNNVAVDIPVVRLMNTVHYIAAYMFVTECSGDQMEYDVLAYDSLSRDKQLVPLTMIVLAAMLQRTEGLRARQCRNVILDNRDPDFEEGVLLYDSFLRSAQAHFEEENFLIDVNTLVTRVQEQDKQINRLTSENIQLKYTITTMEEKYQQINIGTQNINYGTINKYYGFSQPSSSSAEDIISENLSSNSPESDSGNIPQFKYIHVAVTDDREREQIHKMMCNIVRLPRMQQVCDELYILMKKRKVLCTINPEAMLKELRRIGLPGEDQEGFSQKNFQHYYRAPKMD